MDQLNKDNFLRRVCELIAEKSYAFSLDTQNRMLEVIISHENYLDALQILEELNANPA